MIYADEQIARIVHEANRVLQDIHGDDAPSQPWACETSDIRQSAIDGVRFARQGCTPEQLHQAWCDAKAADGWTLGPVKDAAAKTHPCMVPYDQLPEYQKRKDMLFNAIVQALA